MSSLAEVYHLQHALTAVPIGQLAGHSQNNQDAAGEEAAVVAPSRCNRGQLLVGYEQTEAVQETDQAEPELVARGIPVLALQSHCPAHQIAGRRNHPAPTPAKHHVSDQMPPADELASVAAIVAPGDLDRSTASCGVILMPRALGLPDSQLSASLVVLARPEYAIQRI